MTTYAPQPTFVSPAPVQEVMAVIMEYRMKTKGIIFHSIIIPFEKGTADTIESKLWTEKPEGNHVDVLAESGQAELGADPIQIFASTTVLNACGSLLVKYGVTEVRVWRYKHGWQGSTARELIERGLPALKYWEI